MPISRSCSPRVRFHHMRMQFIRCFMTVNSNTHVPLCVYMKSKGNDKKCRSLLPSVKPVGRMLGLPGNVRGHADHQRPSAGSQAQELLEAAHLRDNGTEGRAVARANNQIARATTNEARATMSKARAMANIARTCACASCCCCCCCCWAICTRCCCWSSCSVACCTAACCWSCCCCTCCCCGCSSSLTAVVLCNKLGHLGLSEAFWRNSTRPHRASRS